MSHGTHMNESRHTYEWVMAHIWMSHGTHMNESWHTYEWVMAHISSHGTHVEKSWHIHKGVMAHIWMSHGTHIKSWCICTWLIHVTRMAYVWHDSLMGVTWLIRMWDMMHLYVRHDSFTFVCVCVCKCICIGWRLLYAKTPLDVRHDPFICETWLLHTWDMTHSYVRHDSFIRETWHNNMWDMTPSYVRHDPFICETWLRDMTHSYVCVYVCVSTCVYNGWRKLHVRIPSYIHMRPDLIIRET